MKVAESVSIQMAAVLLPTPSLLGFPQRFAHDFSSRCQTSFYSMLVYLRLNDVLWVFLNQHVSKPVTWWGMVRREQGTSRFILLSRYLSSVEENLEWKTSRWTVAMKIPSSSLWGRRAAWINWLQLLVFFHLQPWKTDNHRTVVITDSSEWFAKGKPSWQSPRDSVNILSVCTFCRQLLGKQQLV